MTRARVAFALLCGLAVCCSVMYITADAESEAVLATAPAKSVYGIGGPTSVDSTDVQKAQTVFTNTPDGRMRLQDYLTNVEKEIAAEASARKREVADVREKMARNFAFNAAARKKLKAALLKRMERNAKKAHKDLTVAMRRVQGKFAAAASLANKRNRANIARSKAIRARIARNKRHAASQLRIAVLAQQKSMAAYKSAINARITQTNKHVAANAAQIKENAKAARKALEKAVNLFDKKTANARAEAKRGRSKLASQMRAQDKSIRQWANNKLKVVMASTAAQFRRVRAKMAADRAHADAMLKSATSRMSASLNAAKALNDRRFAKTVKDIAAAKAEAKARVAAAESEFKTGIYKLTATVKQQVAKTNARITQLSGVVNKNKFEQAKVNANVNAEMKRMIKLGNKRYKQHLKKDTELKRLIQKNKAATDAKMDAMAAHYATELGKVRATMKRNRAHATRMLAKQSAALYAAIAKGEKAQHAINQKLSASTRAARLDVADALRAAKGNFAKRMAKLHANIVRNDKKFQGKMNKLTGIVRANAVKSAKGRAKLAAIMKANKEMLKSAVSSAIHKGEVRMMKAEAKIKDMNKKTKAAMNMRITSQITKLAARSSAQIEGLRLNSKGARAEMKKEMLYAVRSAAKVAKQNLVAAVKASKAKFAAVAKAEAKAAHKSAAARAHLARKISASKKYAARSLDDAVASLNRSLLALKVETSKKIKKTNHRVSAYARRLAKQAKAVNSAMKANMASLTSKINAARRSAKSQIRSANAKSARGFASALKTVRHAMAHAQRKSNRKFGRLYTTMAKNRAHADQSLASSVKAINDSVAKQAALADSRFSHTVKDIAAARAQARKQVSNARKAFATSIAAVTASVKDQETRLTGEIAVVSGEVISSRAAQIRVNRRVSAELKRITKLANARNSESIRARGKMRALLNENKRAAHEEVKALNSLFNGKLRKIRAKAASDSLSAARDLSHATSKMYGRLARIQLKQAYLNKKLHKGIQSYSAAAAAAIKGAKRSFNSRLTTLANVVSANNKKVERGFEVLTGVIRNYKIASKKDRALLRTQTAAMNQDMQKRIVRAVQIGEAKAKRVADRARVNLKATKKALLVEISQRVEATADRLFKTIQGSHQKLADNYLSLKAYAVTASGKITNYVIKGKGKNLSSLGDLLTNVAALSHVKAGKAEGIGAGAKTLPNIFSSSKVKVSNSVSKINGLVNEYTQVTNSVRARWPMGLGKYLLMKLQESMLAKGVLQVDKVSNHAGNFVFLNGRAVGLSNKLNDFESLAVRMGHYESTLAKLTAALAGKVKKVHKKAFRVSPPEWPGN